MSKVNHIPKQECHCNIFISSSCTDLQSLADNSRITIKNMPKMGLFFIQIQDKGFLNLKPNVWRVTLLCTVVPDTLGLFLSVVVWGLILLENWWLLPVFHILCCFLKTNATKQNLNSACWVYMCLISVFEIIFRFHSWIYNVMWVILLVPSTLEKSNIVNYFLKSILLLDLFRPLFNKYS